MQREKWHAVGKENPALTYGYVVLLNSPDCLTVGSIPAKATKADELLNLFISPISARMVAAAIMPIPGMV